MKTHLSLISPVAVAAAASVFCLMPVAFAQEGSTKYSTPSGTPAATSSSPGTSDPSDQPLGAFRPSTNKPSKAELEKQNADGGNNTAKAKSAAAGAGTQLGSQDKSFMMEAAKGGMMEVEMGKMAEKQGQSDDVKKLGKQMVGDHTKANNELMGLAQKKGVKLDTGHKMAKLDSSNFDQAWLAQMAKDHQKMISDFKTESKSGSDSDVKSWANKTLPTLQKHAKMVKDAQGKMAKKS